MNNHGIIVLISCIIIMMGLVVRLLYDLYHIPKVKSPRKAICYKCKYCIKRRHWGRVTKVFCRTPKDKREINYITGKVYKPTLFSCDLRNSRGQCSEYKRRRRPKWLNSE